MEDLLDEEAAAKLLGVSVWTVRKWRETSRYALPFVRIGRTIRYKRADLAAFVETQRVVPDALG